MRSCPLAGAGAAATGAAASCGSATWASAAGSRAPCPRLAPWNDLFGFQWQRGVLYACAGAHAVGQPQTQYAPVPLALSAHARRLAHVSHSGHLRMARPAPQAARQGPSAPALAPAQIGAAHHAPVPRLASPAAILRSPCAAPTCRTSGPASFLASARFTSPGRAARPIWRRSVSSSARRTASSVVAEVAASVAAAACADAGRGGQQQRFLHDCYLSPIISYTRLVINRPSFCLKGGQQLLH